MEATLTADWDAQPLPFSHSWCRIANIDQFRWLSRADVQQHLAVARDEIGITHVRAVAMYSPEMNVWAPRLTEWRTPQSEPASNWQYVDLNIEALLSLGLKPVYTTCFTPLGMALGDKTCWPDGNPIGMPKDLDQWADFVSDGIRHHISRFGRDEVCSWLFECWNEPNLDGFFDGTREDFFQLWSATWRAVKAIDPEMRFGGPSTARGEWIEEFLDHCEADGTPPDYLITHIYNNDSESKPLSPFDGPASQRVKDSPDFASGVIRGVRRLLEKREWTGPVHWNEWGRSWFPHDPLKETALEPAFIVKTMGEVSQEADEFAFWSLSDIYDQCGRQSSEFDGNYGLLSLHGLRKPSWYAHQLLNRLGNSRVPATGDRAGVGLLATWKNGEPAVIIWAYPSEIDAATEQVAVRLNWPFENATLTRLGLAENSIIEDWREMGSPAYPTSEQIRLLRENNSIKPTAHSEIDREGDQVSFVMECPGVAFLEIDQRSTGA